MTANGEALTAGELLAFVSELVDPPTSPQTSVTSTEISTAPLA
jgi:hypothetical protein